MKRVLIVSYHFPPIVSAGVPRIRYITRHLLAEGWRVTVLSVEKSYCEKNDPDTLRWIPPGVEIVRTGSFEVDVIDPGNAASSQNDRGGFLARLAWFLRKVAYRVLFRFLAFPDRQIGWFVPLLVTAERLLRSKRYDVVLSSSPPHSTHLSLWLLRKFRHFKWVADFRDPWTTPSFYYRGGISRAIAEKMERLVLKGCDVVIANTQGNKRALLEKFPFLDSEAVAVVNNGFDEKEEIDYGIDPADVACDFVYTGEVYEGMLDLYIEAVEHLLRNGLGPVPRLFVYGQMDSECLDLLERSPARRYIEWKGSVSYARSLGLMRKANALLLILPHTERGKTWVPSKLYAYLFAGRPILAIAPVGDATDIIARTGTGVGLTNPDPVDVAGSLAHFVDEMRRGRLDLARNEEAISEFSASRVAGRIEKILAKASGP
jgi:hypothetical protein